MGAAASLERDPGMAGRYRASKALATALWADMEQNKPTWGLIGEFVYPWRNECIVTPQRNDATRRSTKIINGAAGLAFNTFRAGMLAGNSSPSQRWFKITTRDRSLNQSNEVKRFFDELDEAIYDDLSHSNAYKALSLDYGDQGLYGTAAMLVIADEDDPLRCYVFPIGSYACGQDAAGRPDKFCRKFRMTASQMRAEFGEWNLSVAARAALPSDKSTKTGEDVFDVWHVISRNDEYRKGASASESKLFKECYFEAGSGESDKGGYATGSQDAKYLRESGYDAFPVIVTRWTPAGAFTPWGVGPGLEILGDVMQLQMMSKDVSNAIEYEVNPAMKGPGALANAYVHRRPGKFTAVDVTQGQQGLEKLFDINLRLDHAGLLINECIVRINEALYKDLFKQFTGNPDRLPKTAYLAQRMFQEKAGNLLPAMEQQYDELLGPLIDRAILIRYEQGRMPKMPEALLGANLKYEYISPFAEAQRAQRTGGTETFLGVVGQLAAVWPEAAQYVDMGPTVAELADGYSIPPALLRDPAEVAAMQEAQAAAMEAQRRAENIPGAAKAVKDLSFANVGDQNALEAVVGAEPA